MRIMGSVPIYGNGVKMRKLGSVPICVLLVAASGVWAQSKLPPCRGEFAKSKWTNCYGSNMTNSGAIYRGEWRDDKFEGQGTYTYRNNTKYVGEFRDGRRNGKGTFSWPDGASYVGEYKDDLRSGKGTFTYPNGSKYVGEYRDDRRHGQGIEYRPDGTILYSGTWENDRYVPTVPKR